MGRLIRRSLRFIDQLHWLWLLLAAPFLMFPSPRRSLVMLVIPCIWILHWILVRVETRKSNLEPENKFRQPAFPATPLNLALLLLAVMVLISLFTTYDLTFSLGKIAGVVLGFGVYFSIVRLCYRESGYWISLIGFVCIGFTIAVLGALGTDWISLTKISVLTSLVTHLPGLVRGLKGAESGFNANEVAGTLVWVLPVAISFFVINLLRFQNFSRVIGKISNSIASFFLMAISLIILGVLVLTQSRGAYIGIAITALLVILVSLPKKWKWILIVGFVLVFIVSGVLVYIHWSSVRDWIISSSLAENPALSVISLNERVVIWSAAVTGIQDFPFTGMGLNTFRTLMHVLYPYANGPFWVDIGHAHNEFLQAGVDLGIPGMIAFISLYIGAFWMLVKTWKTSFFTQKANSERIIQDLKTGAPEILANGIFVRCLVLGLGGGLLAHLLFGLVDAVALGAKPGFVFWMLLGLISGLFALANDHKVKIAYESDLASKGSA